MLIMILINLGLFVIGNCWISLNTGILRWREGANVNYGLVLSCRRRGKGLVFLGAVCLVFRLVRLVGGMLGMGCCPRLGLVCGST